MTPSFYYQDFLRNINLDLFNEYLKSKSLPVITPGKPGSDQLDLMVKYLEELDKDPSALIVHDFIDIQALASDGGTQAVLDLTSDEAFKNVFVSQQNNTCRALYCLIHKPILFDEASKHKQLTSITNFYTRTGLKKNVDADEMNSKIKEFELELIAFLTSKEKRGYVCSIYPYTFDNRVCFFTYPADRAKTFDFYEDGKLDLGKVFSPSFKMIFVYYPKEGKLQLSTRARKKKRQQLFGLFARTVLNDLTPIPEYQQVFNLNRLLSDDFRFKLEPEYQLDSVFVSQMRLDNNEYPKRRFTIQIDKGEGVETIKKELEYRHLLGSNLKHYNVAQATIKLTFKQFGRGNSVTAELTHPDTDNLKETKSNQLAKKCIQDWGLVNDSNSKTAPTAVEGN